MSSVFLHFSVPCPQSRRDSVFWAETENRERAWATSDHSKLGHWLSTKSVAVSAKGNRIALLFMMSSFRRLVAGTFLAPLAVAFKLSLVMW